jgi:hypothetical protein
VETIYVEKVGETSYKILESPIFSCELNYGTIVEAVANEKEELVITKTIKASEYFSRKFILSLSIVETNFPETVGRMIIEAGGTWEGAMGGLLFVHLPKNVKFLLEPLFIKYGINAVEIA